MRRNDEFIAKEYNKTLLPVMFSVMAGVINTLIDTIFVSRRLGSDAMAAVNLTLPVFFIICTFGALFSMGASVVFVNSLGRHDLARAKSAYSTCMALGFIVGVIMFFAGIISPEAISSFLCSDPILYPQVRDYVRISMIGAVFTLMSHIPSDFLPVAGKRRSLSIMMTIMVLLDVIFDYLLMYVFDLGISGAALASVIATAISCTYGIVVLFMQSDLYRFRLKSVDKDTVVAIIKTGSPQAMGNFLDTVRMFVLNWLIYLYGGADALAVWAVINSLAELSLCYVAGIPATGAPMIGVCNGGMDNEGIRLVIKQEIKNAFAASIGFSLIILILSRLIAIFFGIDGSLFVPLLCLGIYTVFESILSILGSFHNVCGRIALSNTIMAMRCFVFQMIFALLLLATSSNIWLFMPLGMGTALLVTLILSFIRSYKSRGLMHELSPVLLLDDYLVKEKKVTSLSVMSTPDEICMVSENIIEFCVKNKMEKKKASRMGLAFEEVMIMMEKKALNDKEMPLDVRIYSIDDQIGISIMCSGNRYNPFEEAEQDDDTSLMGIKLINSLARDCRYIFAMGMNIIEVDF